MKNLPVVSRGLRRGLVAGSALLGSVGAFAVDHSAAITAAQTDATTNVTAAVTAVIAIVAVVVGVGLIISALKKS